MPNGNGKCHNGYDSPLFKDCQECPWHDVCKHGRQMTAKVKGSYLRRIGAFRRPNPIAVVRA
jgi:hypothetical protein